MYEFERSENQKVNVADGDDDDIDNDIIVNIAKRRMKIIRRIVSKRLIRTIVINDEIHNDNNHDYDDNINNINNSAL